MTSTIMMTLVDSGVINLDDSVDTWFPDLPNSDVITVRQLLNHTSGIDNYTTNVGMQLKLITSSDRVWTFVDQVGLIRAVVAGLKADGFRL